MRNGIIGVFINYFFIPQHLVGLVIFHLYFVLVVFFVFNVLRCILRIVLILFNRFFLWFLGLIQLFYCKLKFFLFWTPFFDLFDGSEYTIFSNFMIWCFLSLLLVFYFF